MKGKTIREVITEECIIDGEERTAIAEFKELITLDGGNGGVKFMGMKNNEECHNCPLTSQERFSKCKLYKLAKNYF